VTLQVDRLRQQLEQVGLELEVSDAALEELARRGYDPTFGARPLRRVIQQEVQNPLAAEILKGEFAPGTTTRLDHGADGFSFRTGKPVAQRV
jgi:ATP-dependent Clp protease ATP-binding subunit ClpB